jgi:cell wall-associated NlpC family hydrolase
VSGSSSHPRTAENPVTRRAGGLRRVAVRLLTVAAAACVGLAPAVHAHAAPSPSEIEAQLDKEWEQLEPTVEQYNKVHVQLEANKKKAAELQKQIQPLSVKTALALNRVGDLAARYYMVGPSSELNAVLVNGNHESLANQLTMLDRIAADERARIAAVVAARDKYNAEKQKLDTLIEQQARQEADLAARKKKLEGEVSRLEKLRLAAFGALGSQGGLRKGPCPANYIGGDAGVVVRTACAQIGKPYVFGAVGPSVFDCSGLTQYAWAKVGVHLTHFTGAQWNEGRAVSRADARPGDLVFFYGDLHHVGMYVGNGLMVHAPQPGESVKMTEIDVMPVAGFRRPG